MPSVGSAAAAACGDAAIASVCRGLVCTWSVGVVQCQLARRESLWVCVAAVAWRCPGEAELRYHVNGSFC